MSLALSYDGDDGGMDNAAVRNCAGYHATVPLLLTLHSALGSAAVAVGSVVVAVGSGEAQRGCCARRCLNGVICFVVASFWLDVVHCFSFFSCPPVLLVFLSFFPILDELFSFFVFFPSYCHSFFSFIFLLL